MLKNLTADYCAKDRIKKKNIVLSLQKLLPSPLRHSKNSRPLDTAPTGVNFLAQGIH